MSSKIEILNKILCENKQYEIRDLKVKLEIFDNMQLIKTILNLLQQEINSLKGREYSEELARLVKCFNYLDICVNDLNVNDDPNITSELGKVKKKLERIIKLCDNKGSKGMYIDEEFILEKIKSNIEFMIYKNNPNITVIDEDNVYEFLRYLIFDVKKINYIEEIFSNFPDLVNTTNGEMTIFDELINRYIEQVKTVEGNYEMVYLEKIINYLIHNPKIKINEKQKKKTINNLLNSIDNLRRLKGERKEKQKMKYFLEQLVKDLKDVRTVDYEEKMVNINYKYAMQPEFGRKSLEEVQKIKKINGIYYRDLRDKYVITIDSDGAKSLEDAFSLEVLPNGNYSLGLYISDVASYVKAEDYLDIDAYKRGKTIYLPDQTIPIFPTELTNDFFSLNAPHDKPVISYLFEFSPDMNLINFEVDRSLISIKKNFSHSKVNAILNRGNNIDDFKLLKNMLRFSEKLKNKNSYKDLYHEIKKIRRIAINRECEEYDNGNASNIVMEFMVLLNHFVAYYFHENEIPFIYRINLSNYDKNTLMDIKEKWNNNHRIDDIIKCIDQIYEPSSYSTNNLGHYGLNLNAYSHTTNPARNYISLVNQRLVKKFLIDNEKMSDPYYYQLEEKLSLIAKHINERCELNDAYLGEYCKILYKRHKTIDK